MISVSLLYYSSWGVTGKIQCKYELIIPFGSKVMELYLACLGMSITWD